MQHLRQSCGGAISVTCTSGVTSAAHATAMASGGSFRQDESVPYCSGGASGDATPDYNSRLGYGTDQGRWLAEQTKRPEGGQANPFRCALAARGGPFPSPCRPRRPTRPELSLAPAHSCSQGICKTCSSTCGQLASRCRGALHAGAARAAHATSAAALAAHSAHYVRAAGASASAARRAACSCGAAIVCCPTGVCSFRPATAAARGANAPACRGAEPAHGGTRGR